MLAPPTESGSTEPPLPTVLPRIGSTFASAPTIAGVTIVSFDRVTRSAAGVFSRSTLGSVSLGDVFGNLADVDYILFGLSRDLPPDGVNTPVRAGFQLLDASLTAGEIDRAGQFRFHGPFCRPSSPTPTQPS